MFFKVYYFQYFKANFFFTRVSLFILNLMGANKKIKKAPIQSYANAWFSFIIYAAPYERVSTSKNITYVLLRNILVPVVPSSIEIVHLQVYFKYKMILDYYTC